MGVAEVLKGVRGATGRKSRAARGQDHSFSINLYSDLAIQNIEPFVFTGVAMQRRSTHRRHWMLEDRDRTAGVGIRQFHKHVVTQMLSGFGERPRLGATEKAFRLLLCIVILLSPLISCG